MSIQLEAVNYIYDKDSPFATTALTNLSLEVEDGDFIGVIGHTGSGKSSLMQILNGLLKPVSGKVYIQGVDITDSDVKLSDVRKKVGMVFQYPEYQLFEESVYKDVAYGPKNLLLSTEEIDKRVRHALAAVGLPEDKWLDKSPFELSGGQKRRVALAGILAMESEVLILDEPTAGLDPQGKTEILNLIYAEHLKRKNTVFLVSHSMEDVAKYVNKILVMAGGELLFFDTPANVFAKQKELKTIGLDIPEAAKIANELRAKGINLKADIYTDHELIEELVVRLGD